MLESKDYNFDLLVVVIAGDYHIHHQLKQTTLLYGHVVNITLWTFNVRQAPKAVRSVCAVRK